jgi:hypothetical protein
LLTLQVFKLSASQKRTPDAFDYAQTRENPDKRDRLFPQE